MTPPVSRQHPSFRQPVSRFIDSKRVQHQGNGGGAWRCQRQEAAVPKNRSINTAVTPAVAFDPNSLWVSPILPCHKSNCHQLVGAEVFDTAPDPTTELPACSHDINVPSDLQTPRKSFCDRAVGSLNRPDFAGHWNGRGAHRGDFRQVRCATGLTALLQLRSVINLIFGSHASDADQRVILMALDFQPRCMGGCDLSCKSLSRGKRFPSVVLHTGSALRSRLFSCSGRLWIVFVDAGTSVL